MPNPRVKKAPDPGSATLIITYHTYSEQNYKKFSENVITYHTYSEQNYKKFSEKVKHPYQQCVRLSRALKYIFVYRYPIEM
jgi:hypothetical protein